MRPQPVPKPPKIEKDSQLAEVAAPEDIKNPFERTARMIVDAADDYAKRMSEGLSEQAADRRRPVDPSTINEMMHFSRYGTDAPTVFWQDARSHPRRGGAGK